MLNIPVVIGSIGVFLLLVSFFLNLFKILKQDTKTYTTINILGAGMSCYAAILIGFVPFVVLEGIWAVVALAGLIRLLRKKKDYNTLS